MEPSEEAEVSPTKQSHSLPSLLALPIISAGGGWAFAYYAQLHSGSPIALIRMVVIVMVKGSVIISHQPREASQSKMRS